MVKAEAGKGQQVEEPAQRYSESDGQNWDHHSSKVGEHSLTLGQE